MKALEVELLGQVRAAALTALLLRPGRALRARELARLWIKGAEDGHARQGGRVHPGGERAAGAGPSGAALARAATQGLANHLSAQR